MPVDYSKRRERTREISIDLGDGDTIEAKYRPTRLTLSLLQRLEEAEKGAASASGKEEGIGDADREKQWQATAEALCELVVSWNLTDFTAAGVEYFIPLTPEGLRESDFDLLDMLAIIKAIQEDASPDPPTAGP